MNRPVLLYLMCIFLRIYIFVTMYLSITKREIIFLFFYCVFIACLQGPFYLKLTNEAVVRNIFDYFCIVGIVVKRKET